MNNFKIRRARIDDISSCLAIYNYEVVNGVATLDLEPRTLTEWQGGSGMRLIKLLSAAFL